MLGLVQETVVTRWRADPWSRGSYSYVSTGSHHLHYIHHHYHWLFRVFTDLKEVFEVYDLTALSRESEPEGFQKPGAYQKRNSYVTLIISSFFCIIIMLLLSSPVRYLLFLWPTLSYIFLLLITARYIPRYFSRWVMCKTYLSVIILILTPRHRRIGQRLRQPGHAGDPRESGQGQWHAQESAADFLWRRAHYPQLSRHRARCPALRAPGGRQDCRSGEEWNFLGLAIKNYRFYFLTLNQHIFK